MGQVTNACRSACRLLWNRTLEGLPVYKPGKPIEEVARELGLPFAELIKLASNENPLGPAPKAIAAIRDNVHLCHLYPDGNGYYLKEKLAQKLGVPMECIILGNGSNEILELVGHALIGPGKQVIVSQYCFAVYPIVTHLFGGTLVEVPAKDYAHDPEAMLGAVTGSTAVIFVANPNNPTGTVVDPNGLIALVERVPEHALLVVDEAYIEYLDEPLDLLRYVKAGKPNLLLVRTFSKIYGLAGLRIGYGLGHPDVIRRLDTVREPFNTNRLAQVAALAALDDEEHVKRTREVNRQGLRFFESEFKRLGLEFVPSFANFILVRVGDGNKVFERLQMLGVIVRPMGPYGLPEWVRISVGTPAQNERCIQALSKLLGR